jgi:hypothetical protein
MKFLCCLSSVLLVYLLLLALLLVLKTERVGSYSQTSQTVTVTQTQTQTVVPQNVFFKEILRGRCYQNPPSGKSEDQTLCPLIADAFVSAIEGRLDSQVTTESFDLYWNWADVRCPTSSSTSTTSSTVMPALVWPPSLAARIAAANNNNKAPQQHPLLLFLPEMTPGAALVQDLVFCGVDKRKNCPTEFYNQQRKHEEEEQQGAMWAFWKGVYSQFLNSIGIGSDTTTIQLVILPDDNEHEHGLTTTTNIPAFWNQSVLPFIQQIHKVNIVTIDCQSKVVEELTSALSSKNHTKTATATATVTCKSIIGQTLSSSKQDAYISEYCAIMEEIETQIHTNSNSDSNKEDDKQKASSNNSQEECHCSDTATTNTAAVVEDTTTNTTTNIYEILFWGLIVIIAGCAYAFWSVRHYLPHYVYQRIPNVSSEHNNHDDELMLDVYGNPTTTRRTRQPGLPKQ